MKTRFQGGIGALSTPKFTTHIQVLVIEEYEDENIVIGHRGV